VQASANALTDPSPGMPLSHLLLVVESCSYWRESSKRLCYVSRVRETEVRGRGAHILSPHRTTQSSLLSACRYSCASFCQWTHRSRHVALSCSHRELVILEAQSQKKMLPLCSVLASRVAPCPRVCGGAGSRCVVAEQKILTAQREQAVQGHDCASLHALSL
jgi:hypothetical protein